MSAFACLSSAVHLSLNVRHEPGWREDENLLAELARDGELT